MSTRLESFQALKDKRQAALSSKEALKKVIEIRVAMGTCAIATGAKEVFDVFEKMLASNPLENVTLKETGCMGYCYAEPTVEVTGVAAEPVMFGNVDEKIARQIIEDYILKQEPVNARVETCHINA